VLNRWISYKISRTFEIIKLFARLINKSPDIYAISVGAGSTSNLDPNDPTKASAEQRS
jgi:hypothetical protein